MPVILLLFFLTFGPPAAVSAMNQGGRVEYVGGTLVQVSRGADGALQTIDPGLLRLGAGKLKLEVPYERINLLEYGQHASRRIVMAAVVSPLFLLSKSRKHFLTIGFQDEAGNQQAMVFRVAKGDVRALLASLEARTGLRVQYQDDEARKSGKG